MASFPTTVLLGDPRLPDRTKPKQRYTAEDLDAVVRLKHALTALTGVTFDWLDDHDQLIDRLRASPPSLVLNFCDNGFRNDPAREPHVAALLELLDIPYSGSGPAALALCYDKSLVRALAASLGIAVPRETCLARADDELPLLDGPAFIKPNRADGSVGISARSLVSNVDEARAYLDALGAAMPGEPLLVQEYLDGPEYSLALIGNPGQGFTTLAPLEVDYDGLDPALPRLLDYGSKTDPASPYWTDVSYRPAALDRATVARLGDDAARLFARLGLHDYARFDFRTDRYGTIKLLEVNPNPAWCWDGKLNLMAGFAGMNYAELLELLLDTARRRYRYR